MEHFRLLEKYRWWIEKYEEYIALSDTETIRGLNITKMKKAWFIILLPFFIAFAKNDKKGIALEYDISSTALNEIVETLIDSCSISVGCADVEFLYIKTDSLDNEYSIYVETIRKSPDVYFPIFYKQQKDIVCFYIGETLCFSAIDIFKVPGLFEEKQFLESKELSNYLFEYSCLDILHKGDIYNTLVFFDFRFNTNQSLQLENYSIFIDAGDVDISEALRKRGIKG